MSDGRFSVIIPTLQRSAELRQLVERCTEHRLVLEVLVVNNAPEPLAWASPKVRVLQQAENIYVNPAWNLGAREARGDWLAILNDDVLFDTSLFDRAARWMRMPWVGIVGPDPSCFTGGGGSKPWFRPVYWRRWGYGTVMFMARERYHPIPATLLIWYGDDWLFSRQLRRNWTFGGFDVQTPMGATTGAPEFNPQLDADEATYRSYGEGGYRRRYAMEDRLVAALIRLSAQAKRLVGAARP